MRRTGSPSYVHASRGRNNSSPTRQRGSEIRNTEFRRKFRAARGRDWEGVASAEPVQAFRRKESKNSKRARAKLQILLTTKRRKRHKKRVVVSDSNHERQLFVFLLFCFFAARIVFLCLLCFFVVTLLSFLARGLKPTLQQPIRRKRFAELADARFIERRHCKRTSPVSRFSIFIAALSGMGLLARPSMSRQSGNNLRCHLSAPAVSPSL